MGVLKVYNMAPELVKGGDLVDVLYDMLRDSDGLVVTNCINALDEIMLEEGGIAINKAIIHSLLGRLNDFSEWGLQAVLRLVTRYQPESDEETFQIMNVLDPVLRTTNSGVVLEAVGCFLRLTRRARRRLASARVGDERPLEPVHRGLRSRLHSRRASGHPNTNKNRQPPRAPRASLRAAQDAPHHAHGRERGHAGQPGGHVLPPEARGTIGFPLPRGL